MSKKLPRRDRVAVWLAAGVALLMIAQQIASKAVRDALFLSRFDASAIPVAAIAAAVFSVVMVVLVSRLMTRFSPAGLVPVLFLASAGLYGFEWYLSGVFPRIAAASIYVHTATFGAAVVSGFWSVINERFDPYTAKRVIPVIGAGATAGGMVGGLGVWQAASAVPVSAMILILAVLNVIAGGGLLLVGRGSPDKSRSGTPPAGVKAMLGEVSGQPYLRNLALFVFIGAVGTACFDYVFKARASESLGSEEALISFFAVFYLVTGVATLLVQAGLAKRVLSRLGLVVSISFLPGAVALLSGVALVVPGFFSVVALRGAATVLENSLYRSGYELLYTPIPVERKRAVKMLIDVAFDRLGTAAGGGLSLLFIAWFASSSSSALLLVAIVAAALILGLLFRIHRGYVRSLAGRLKSSVGGLDEAELSRVAMRRAVTSTMGVGTVDPQMGDHGLASSHSSPAGVADSQTLQYMSRAELSSRLASRVDALRRVNDDEETRTERPPRPTRPAPAARGWAAVRVAGAILELGEEDPTAAMKHLSRAAPGAAGQLLDALLSPRHGTEARARVAAVLAGVPVRRVALGLTIGLEDPSLAVRLSCAQALSEVIRISPALRPESKLVFNVVEAELGRPLAPPSRPHSPAPAPFSRDDDGRPVSATVQLVFTLLTIVLEQEPVTFAFRALHDADRATRGTGMEYIENVVPQRVRTAMGRYLEEPTRWASRPRPPSEVIDELARVFGSGEKDLATIRAEYAAARAS